MNTRFYDRMAAGVSVLLLAVLAAASFYLAELAQRFGFTGPKKMTHEVDFFVENFAVVRLNPRGEPVFRVSAKRMVHYPDDDSSEFDKPHLVSLDPTKPLVTITAERGKASSEGEQTHLYDNVVLTRAATADQAEIKVRSNYMLLLPDEEIARTHLPVSVVQGASSLTGVGMEFNNAARQLDVKSQVRGVWVSKPGNDG